MTRNQRRFMDPLNIKHRPIRALRLQDNPPEQLSRCCDAPVYFVHEGGPVCKKCGKWAVTKPDAQQKETMTEKNSR